LRGPIWISRESITASFVCTFDVISGLVYLLYHRIYTFYIIGYIDFFSYHEFDIFLHGIRVSVQFLFWHSQIWQWKVQTHDFFQLKFSSCFQMQFFIKWHKYCGRPRDSLRGTTNFLVGTLVHLGLPRSYDHTIFD